MSPGDENKIFSPFFFPRALAIKQFQKKGENLHVENEAKINSATS